MSELLKINVNEHVEKKNGLTYLSWAWAWAEVLKIDHQALWTPIDFGTTDSGSRPYLSLPDGTMMVGVVVKIKNIERRCLLPVMDYKNKAIKNPDAFSVNTAMMRCLAKAIAMHGLGLYIYAGEDLPEEDKASAVIAPARVAAEEAATLIPKERQDEIYRDLDDAIALAENNGKTTPLIEYYYSLANNEEKMVAWNALGSFPGLRRMLKDNQPKQG